MVKFGGYSVILPIVLFILILLIVCVVVTFIYYIFLPKLEKQGNNIKDAIVSFEEKNYVKDLDIAVESSDKKALVLCSCNKKFQLNPISFKEQYTCFMVKDIHGSGTDCRYACIGLGDCAKICPQQAIDIINHTAVVSSLCIGCGRCISVCPQKIITLVSKASMKMVICNNVNPDERTSCSDKGKEENVQWNASKRFKIWSYCYRIIKRTK